jgi:hypothetical protein
MSVIGPTQGQPLTLLPFYHRETLMVKKRTAKRAPAKKRAGARPASKRGTKRTTKKASSSKKKTTRARALRGPIARVRVAGEKTWKALKSTTAHVVEGVKGTFGTEESPDGR